MLSPIILFVDSYQNQCWGQRWITILKFQYTKWIWTKNTTLCTVIFLINYNIFSSTLASRCTYVMVFPEIVNVISMFFFHVFFEDYCLEINIQCYKQSATQFCRIILFSKAQLLKYAKSNYSNHKCHRRFAIPWP